MDNWNPEANEIFVKALAFESSDDRQGYLDEACGADADLRNEVESLLKADAQAGSFLDSPGDMAPTLGFAPIAEKPGMKIGRYKLVHEIGHGGMGVVYMAVQKEPVKRKVALKIIKPGMDTREVVTRFEGERQALALMDHQSIAKVLDGGSTESGRPYFVMELVEGTRITEFCDEARYNTRQRLELFGQVCRAVQHAHQKGIIHRDLKPSNILVTNYDHVAVPKVIDFGIAKAVHQPLTDQSVYTNVSQMIGTPLYMSPEQAQRSGLDIDTRTDVYSLGVLLYELLTGTTPFEKERLQNSSLDEVKRIIREEDPPKPSTRFSTLNAAQETVAEKHSTNPRSLSHELCGELDWIVMKALEKDRSRRYESANELTKDVQRYLDDEPVEACPPSKLYRFGKFARRHRAAMISGSAVLLSTMMVLVAITLAALSRSEAADRQRELADQRAQVQRGINDALTEVARLRGRIPTDDVSDQSALIQAREQAQRALALAETGPVEPTLVAQVKQLSEELNEQQRERRLLSALDKAWLAQADMIDMWFNSHACLPHLRDALNAYGIKVGQMSPTQCATVIRESSTTVQSELLAALYEWHALVKPLSGINLRSLEGEVVVESLMPNSTAARDGRLKPGDRLVGVSSGTEQPLVEIKGMTVPDVNKLLSSFSGEVCRIKVIPKGEDEPLVYDISRDPVAVWLDSVLNAADQDAWRQRFREACRSEALATRREALKELVNQVDIDQQPVRVLVRLAKELRSMNESEQAIRLLRQIWQMKPNDVQTNLNLALLLRSSEPPQTEEAIRYYTAAIALRPESYGLRINLGNALAAQQNWQEAIIQYGKALAIEPKLAIVHKKVGDVFVQQAIHSSGEEKIREAIVRYREASGMRPDDAGVRRGLGNVLQMLGEWEEATAEYQEARRLDPEDAWTRYNLARLLQMQGRTDEAIVELRAAQQLEHDSRLGFELGKAFEELGQLQEAVAAYRNEAAKASSSAYAHMSLATALMEQGRQETAIAEIRKAVQLRPDDPRCLNDLAWVLATVSDVELRNSEEALTHAKRAVELAPKIGIAWNTMGVAQYRSGDWEAAIESLKKAIELGPRSGSLEKCINFQFLAMAHWQLGRRGEARWWYEKASKWRRFNKVDDGAGEQQLARFQAEVDKLGIEGVPPEKPSDLQLWQYPVVRFEPSENASVQRTSDEVAVVVMNNTYPNYEKGKAHHDSLRCFTSTAECMWTQSGLGCSDLIGGNHVAVDSKRGRIYVSEDVADRVTRFDVFGNRVWQINRVDSAAALMVDPLTGNLWCSGHGEIVVFDQSGAVVADYPCRVVDMAYDASTDAFWLVGKQILKLDRSGKILFRESGDGWFFTHIAVSPKDGCVWIVESRHSQVPLSKNCVWLRDADGSVRKRIDMGNKGVGTIACLPTGEALIVAGGFDRRTVEHLSLDGEVSKWCEISDPRAITTSRAGDKIWITTQSELIGIDVEGAVICRSPLTPPSVKKWIAAF